MKTIKLTGGNVALVDDEDYNYLSRFNWYFGGGYPARDIYYNKKWVSVLMVDFIYDRRLQSVFTYKDKNPCNLQKSNILLGTQSDRQAFAKKRKGKTSSKYKGVTFHKLSGKWRASISFHKNKFSLGLFEDEDDAARAYNKRATQLYGEFAYQNKIDS